MALKKGADRAISSKVNQTSVVLPFMEWQSSHNLVFLQMRIRNLQKKATRRRKIMTCPPKREEEVTQWREMSIMTGFSFLCMWYSVTPLFIVSCLHLFPTYQTSDGKTDVNQEKKEVSYSHSIQTKGKYALCAYLEFFSSKDNLLYLSILLIDSQAPEEECFGKDCRSINFRQNHVSSCAIEQIEESVNMLFVIYAMKAFKNGEEIKGGQS